MEYSSIRSTIYGCNTDQDVFRGGFSVCYEHVEIAIGGKDTSIEQFELGTSSAAMGILVYQLLIGESSLWIFVEHRHIAVAGSAVKVEVDLFDIFAVVALWTGQTKQAFFENRVLSIPQRQRKA